jgi:hypothetical protein
MAESLFENDCLGYSSIDRMFHVEHPSNYSTQENHLYNLKIEKIYQSLGSRSLCPNDRYGIVYYSQLLNVLTLVRDCCDLLLPQVE